MSASPTGPEDPPTADHRTLDDAPIVDLGALAFLIALLLLALLLMLAMARH